MIIVEARAWIRKYFRADSDKNEFGLVVIRGINDIRFISNPIQAPNQEEEEIEIRVPEINVKKKN